MDVSCFFLLLHLLLEYAVAMPLAENPLEQNEKTSVEWNGDSVQIYNNLIADENLESISVRVNRRKRLGPRICTV